MSTSPMHNCLIPAVMRSQVRSEISLYITSKQVNDIRLGEYLQGYFPHIRGKYHYNPALISLVRDTSVLTSQKQKNIYLMHSSESSTTRYPSVQYYIDNNLDEFFNSFRMALIRELGKNISLPLDDIRKFVLNNFPNSYFSRYYLERVTIMNRLSSPFVRILWNSFPLIFKSLIEKSVQLLFSQTLPINTNEEDINADDSELNLILDIVRETMIYHSGDKRLSELDL